MPTKKMKKAVHKNCYQFDCSRSRVGTVVRTLISHQCVLVPIPDSVPQVCGGQEDSTFPLSTPFNPPPFLFDHSLIFFYLFFQLQTLCNVVYFFLCLPLPATFEIQLPTPAPSSPSTEYFGWGFSSFSSSSSKVF